MVISRWPQGQETSQSLVSCRLLTAKELDPDFVDFNSVNRRYHFLHREYAPFKAAFLQVDPLLRIAKIRTDEAIAQAYQYAGGTPLQYVDPTGLAAKEAYQCDAKCFTIDPCRGPVMKIGVCFGSCKCDGFLSDLVYAVVLRGAVLACCVASCKATCLLPEWAEKKAQPALMTACVQAAMSVFPGVVAPVCVCD